MAAKVGRAAAIKLKTTKVAGNGTLSISGSDADLLEDTEFGDTFKTYMIGLRDGGTITFDGYYDPTDSTGQTILRTYWSDGTDVTSLRIYIDANSYWSCVTGGHVNITSWEIGIDKSGLATASFTAKVSGRLAFN